MSVAFATVRRLILGVATAIALVSCTARADQPPAVARIAVLAPLGNTTPETGLRQGLSELGYTEGKNLSIEWRRYAQSTDAIRSAAAELVRSRVDLIKIAETVRRAKLPTLVPTRDYWGEGELISYGPSLKEMGRRAAAYVDKILRGTKPGDLPIEQGVKFELVIDVRVARELGLKVPQDLLLHADEVIR